MTILDLIRPNPGEPARLVTLDDLVHEASAIGGLRVWQYKRGHSYDVTIKFERRTGSEIEAKASHSDLQLALRAAIDEARALGAA